MSGALGSGMPSALGAVAANPADPCWWCAVTADS